MYAQPADPSRHSQPMGVVYVAERRLVSPRLTSALVGRNRQVWYRVLPTERLVLGRGVAINSRAATWWLPVPQERTGCASYTPGPPQPGAGLCCTCGLGLPPGHSGPARLVEPPVGQVGVFWRWARCRAQSSPSGPSYVEMRVHPIPCEGSSPHLFSLSGPGAAGEPGPCPPSVTRG